MKSIIKNILKIGRNVLSIAVIGFALLNGVSSVAAQLVYIDHESPPINSQAAVGLLLEPHPKYSPDEVIQLQIEGFAENNTPYNNAGVELAFRFASPSNKEVTGSLRRFTRIVYNSFYRPLLNHQIAHYGELQMEGDKALQLVVLTTSKGVRVSYIFVLSRQTGGHYEDCWMTDTVLPLPGFQDV